MIARLLRAARGQGLRKGVMGGNRRWLTIWALVAAVQTVHKLTKPKPVVEKFALRPGETLVITDFGEASPAP